MGEPLLEVVKVSKTFPGVKALSHVDFALTKGEIHGLMGENGAGKSTLIKIITGVYQKDEGSILLNGKEIHPSSPMHAEELGISTVYQEVNLLPNLSVTENLCIGRQKTIGGAIDWKQMNKYAVDILRAFEIDIDVTEMLGSFSIAVQQMIAIARALELDSKLLILDEPTSSLNLDEVAMLFRQMSRLKEKGHTIIFVTHFLDQVFEITDRITVLRNGEYVGVYETQKLSKIELISKLMGRALNDLQEFEREVERIPSERTEAVLSAEGLSKTDYLKSCSVHIGKGEVVGLAGLLGSGRTEIANVLFGLVKPDRGTIKVKNRNVRITNPRKAIQNHIALCPEDRKKDGIIAGLSVRENIVLAMQVKQGWLRNINKKKQMRLAERYIQLLGIKTSSPNTAIDHLSGGNQQKVIIARWLATKPDILIVDEPTRGIDVGAKAEIQKLIVQLSSEGMGSLFISSEIEEVVRCSKRVYVFQDKEVVEELADEDINEQKIMHAIAAGKE